MHLRPAARARGGALTVVRNGTGRRARRLVLPVSALMVLTATPASAQLHDDHVIEVPITIGPLVLKVAVLLALPAVAGFAMMRGFLGAPGRNTAAFVSVCAAVAVSMELMLATGFALPPIAVPLSLAAVGLPVYLAFADGGPPPAVLRWLGPGMLLAACAVAAAVFARAWLLVPPGAERLTILHTGMIVAFAGLAWLTTGVPENRVLRGGVLTVAAVLGFALVGAGTQVAALG